MLWNVDSLALYLIESLPFPNSTFFRLHPKIGAANHSAESWADVVPYQIVVQARPRTRDHVLPGSSPRVSDNLLQFYTSSFMVFPQCKLINYFPCKFSAVAKQFLAKAINTGPACIVLGTRLLLKLVVKSSGQEMCSRYLLFLPMTWLSGLCACVCLLPEKFSGDLFV